MFDRQNKYHKHYCNKTELWCPVVSTLSLIKRQTQSKHQYFRLKNCRAETSDHSVHDTLLMTENNVSSRKYMCAEVAQHS